MKIADYEKVSLANSGDTLLLDTPAGTKGIAAKDLGGSLIVHGATPEMHRMLFRGKNLGSSVTDAQKAAIQDGSFTDLFVGDYWEIGGVKWRIVDIDYFYMTGGYDDTDRDTMVKHHLVVMPDTTLYTHKMEETSTTANGYKGCLMRTSGLNQAKTTIDAAFPGLVLPHEEIMVYCTDFTSTNPSDNGPSDYESAFGCTVEIPSEIMMYGSLMCGIQNLNSAIRYDKQQFALFAIQPRFIVAGEAHMNAAGDGIDDNRPWFWLRDVVSSVYFAYVGCHGAPDFSGAVSAVGVRPYFLLG